MRYFYLFVLIILFYSCKNKVIDITPPEFVTYFYNEDNIIFQFSEPIKKFSIIRDDTKELLYEISNQIAIANNYCSDKYFVNYNSDIILKASDNSSNESETKIEKPYIPQYVPEIEIKDIYLKPSKNKKQFLNINIKKGGSVMKYKLFYFSGRKIVYKKFDDIFLKIGLFKLIFDQTKSCDLIDKSLKVYDENKISSSNGIIGIIDYKNCIVDFVIYFEADKGENFYSTNKYYKEINNFIKEYNIEIKPQNLVAISKITTKTLITKNKNQYFVNKM